jgi:hypothetical protein
VVGDMRLGHAKLARVIPHLRVPKPRVIGDDEYLHGPSTGQEVNEVQGEVVVVEQQFDHL